MYALELIFSNLGQNDIFWKNNFKILLCRQFILTVVQKLNRNCGKKAVVPAGPYNDPVLWGGG